MYGTFESERSWSRFEKIRVDVSNGNTDTVVNIVVFWRATHVMESHLSWFGLAVWICGVSVKETSATTETHFEGLAYISANRLVRSAAQCSGRG